MLCGIFLRMICEAFDIALYGAILQQTGAALVASALLAWEIAAVLHILKRLKGTQA